MSIIRNVKPGDKYNHLTLIKVVGEHEYLQEQEWLCECDCGKQVIVTRKALLTNSRKSCGCIIGKSNIKHGLSRTRIDRIYRGMINRCYRKSVKAYSEYGGRGITVCDEWRDKEHGIEKFYEWAMKNGYQDNLSIDRIDNDKGYSPDNCRWTDRDTQANNRRNNIILEYKGEKHTISSLAKMTNIKKSTLYSRIVVKGWSVEEAVEKEVEHLIEYNGESHTIPEWSEITGIYKETIRYRLKNGWSVEKTLTQKHHVKYIDIVDIKKTVENGQFISYVKGGVIYLKDNDSGEVVEIGRTYLFRDMRLN